MACSQLATNRSSPPPSTTRTPAWRCRLAGRSRPWPRRRSRALAAARQAGQFAQDGTSGDEHDRAGPEHADRAGQRAPQRAGGREAGHREVLEDGCRALTGRSNIAVPSVEASTTSWPARRPASTTLAATDTARSSDRPAWALRRRSSTTAVACGRGCSSWRTTRSPVLAEDRQCTGGGRRRPRTHASPGTCHARRPHHLAVADRGRLLLASRWRRDAVGARIDNDLDRAAHGEAPPGEPERVRAQRLERADVQDPRRLVGKRCAAWRSLPGRSGANLTRAPTVPATGSRSVRTGVDSRLRLATASSARALADVEAGRPHGSAHASESDRKRTRRTEAR